MIWRVYRSVPRPLLLPSGRHDAPLIQQLSINFRRTASSSSSATLKGPLLERFQTAVRSGSLRQIKTSYDRLRTCLLANNSQKDFVVDEETFTKAMGIMSRSTAKDEINIVFIMFADLTSLFGRQPEKAHRLAVLQAMISRGWHGQALARLREKYSDPEECALVMTAFQRLGQRETALAIFTESIQAGVDPNPEMYRTLFLCSEQLKEPAKLESFADVMREYLSGRTARAVFNNTFWKTLIPTLVLQQTGPPGRVNQADIIPSNNNSHPASATTASESIEIRDDRPTEESSDVGYESILQELEGLLQKRNFTSGLLFLENRQKRGIKITRRMVNVLATAASKSSELMGLSDKFGLVADAETWAALIAKTAKLKGLPAAFEVFKEAKEYGVTPIQVLAIPLFRRFCEEKIRTTSETRLQEAIELYRDILKSSPPNIEHDSSPMHRQSWTMLYDSLLRMLTNTADPESTFSVAIAVLNDMAQYNISFDLTTATSLILLLVRSSPSHDAAYEICAIFQEHYGNVLDAKSCEAVLGAFSQLSFPHQQFTPPSLFFMMLNNLQRTGFQLSKRAYTTILSHIAKTCAHSETPARAADAIRQIHKRLLLDSTLTPDTPLLNSLMNAYNRAGSPVEAIRVWESLYLQGKHDNTSLSIVLDTLSHAQALNQAARIMAKIHRSGFQLDRNNWQSWLELLCRAKKFEEATNLLYFDMRNANPPMVPDQEHIGTLLKYSWDSGRRREIQSRIRRYWPSIWSSLPDDMKA